MRLFTITIICVCIIFSSCKKETRQSDLVGKWVWAIEYANNPAYNFTPQSTGIHEILSFDKKNSYSVAKNGIIVNSGTYKTIFTANASGNKVPGILYTNTRVTDSAAYFLIRDNNDSLIFSNDLIGTAGSGTRHYGKQ